MITGVGFVSSATVALVSNRAQYRRWKPSVEMLQNFLESTGIYLELAQALNVRLLDNTVILGRIQKILDGRGGAAADIRDRVLANTAGLGAWLRAGPSPVDDWLHEECLRYMRYATAAYGESMIRAAELDVSGTFDSRLMPVTRTRISEHIGVPEDDIVVLDVDYGGDVEHLRHIVAVDHARRTVVLAIRGTFSLGELVVDVAGFSRPFCGGEAHAEMANMTERVWQVAGPTVLRLLEENDGYELVLTGHSLGAGTASLLNIMCHQRGREMVNGRKVRCFAFACPPVFTPIEFAGPAAKHCVSVIHERDVVPFLSVDSVRHFFNCIRVVEDHLKGKGFRNRMSYVTGYADIEPSLIEAVQKASQERLPPKQGAPILVIPAATNLWLRQIKDDHDGGGPNYDVKACDSVKLSTFGIRVDPNMLQDHLPPRYEHALHNLKR
jgi:Lipase (class 3)